MNILNTRETIEEKINNNEIVLMYFGSQNCSVCVDLKPKIEEILYKYPKILKIDIDLDKEMEIGSKYGFFTIPGIILFIKGKEYIREARLISVIDIDRKIQRYYELLFEE